MRPPRTTVELDIALEEGETLIETLNAMVKPRTYVDIDTDRTACCRAEEVWDEEDLRYECDSCGLCTRATIQYQLSSLGSPTSWASYYFQGPRDDIEQMLKKHGYDQEPIETYLVEEVI